MKITLDLENNMFYIVFQELGGAVEIAKFYIGGEEQKLNEY